MCSFSHLSLTLYVSFYLENRNYLSFSPFPFTFLSFPFLSIFISHSSSLPLSLSLSPHLFLPSLSFFPFALFLLSICHSLSLSSSFSHSFQSISLSIYPPLFFSPFLSLPNSLFFLSPFLYHSVSKQKLKDCINSLYMYMFITLLHTTHKKENARHTKVNKFACEYLGNLGVLLITEKLDRHKIQHTTHHDYTAVRNIFLDEMY